MADKHQNDPMDEEGDDFKTPQPLEKKKKKKKTKRTPIESTGSIDITVKQISEKPDRISPIVAYFASGYDPSSSSSQSGEAPKVTVYKTASQKRTEVVVSPPGSNVEFVGSSHGGQVARQTCVYTLGVLDKETQTLRILPIAHSKVLRLETRVKGNETVDSEAGESAVTTEGDEEESADHRPRTFWTKRAILDDKKRKARVLKDDPDAQKALEDKLDKVDVNISALEATNADVARNIPPHNASATIPKDAYPIEQIIEKGEWSQLQDVYRLLQQEAGASTEGYPTFVRNRLFRLRDNKDETEKETVAGILTLLTHLIKFKDVNSMVGVDSARKHHFPTLIRDKCNRLFKDFDTSRRIPDDKVNLLISYVLVLTLHVDKFKTDFEDIAKDLRMSSMDLRKHFENLGCKFSVENKIRLATLPVPLQFPQIMRRRKKRQR
ncbi:DNA binding / DNA-directed RNA polymerase [Hirschfeldia incana]|nr:DNA binding / DNA-directed RNA polymerase [Hirschfeldia incana]